MTAHSFVDESKEPSYLLVAALIRPAHLSQMRQTMAGMVLPRQRRIHFNNERDSRKAQIMNQLLEMPIEAMIYRTNVKHQKVARHDCLTALVHDHIDRDIRRLVLERDDSFVDFDRRLLQAELRLSGVGHSLTYEHARAFEEPLLSVPDAIAWCWARGGHWRVKAKPLVVAIQEL